MTGSIYPSKNESFVIGSAGKRFLCVASKTISGDTINGNLLSGTNGSFTYLNVTNSISTELGSIYVDNGAIRSQDTYNKNTVTNSPNLYVTSNGWIRRTTNTSSKRYKKDIKKLTDENLNPEKLYNLEVKQFKYKDKYQPNENDPRHNQNLIGFIAEDVAKVFPIAADYEIDKNGNVIVENWNERYMIPAMLKLIQELHKEIDELKRKG